VPKRKTVQYFMFFPERFEASEQFEDLDVGFIDDWDYALVVDGVVETLYAAGDRPTKWMAEGKGINGLGLKLMGEGDYGYEKFPQWKRLGK
jgi:hypothetical protein